MTHGTTIVVVTVAAGRHDHLAAQIRGLASSSLAPAEHIVVAMGDKKIAAVVGEKTGTGPNTDGSDTHGTDGITRVVHTDVTGPSLPLAHARNLGARTAFSRGADLVVFLDVDCIPGTDMLARYADAASRPQHRRTLLCGPVTYLPPNPSGWTPTELRAHTDPHPARPNPSDGVVETGSNYDLFWSLSFAVTPDTWDDIGGFFPGYSGYGGEDTDFAATAHAAGIGLRWVGGAHAYHQHHPVSSPPLEHLDDIVRNSAVFHRRWNRWPMEGWLSEFENRGLITRTSSGDIRRTGEQPYP